VGGAAVPHEEALRCGGATDVAKRAVDEGFGKGIRRVPERAARARILLKRCGASHRLMRIRDGIGDDTAWLIR
jgi:hypothetical protein